MRESIRVYEKASIFNILWHNLGLSGFLFAIVLVCLPITQAQAQSQFSVTANFVGPYPGGTLRDGAGTEISSQFFSVSFPTLNL